MDNHLECGNVLQIYEIWKCIYAIWDKMKINSWNEDCALSHITKTTWTINK